LLIPITILPGVLGLTSNHIGLVGPETALGIPFGTLIVNAAIDEIPAALEDAAEVDGAGNFAVLMLIVVPRSG
jgi:ABC-type glycerol-3-phosphate transport system permease component